MREEIADWLALLQAPEYDWHSRNPAASEGDLDTLADYFGRPLPANYAAFLRAWSGAEVSCRGTWRMRLWSARDIPAWSSAYGFTPERMPNAGAFGDNGGGEALVFDLRPERIEGAYPVMAVNFVSISWSEAIPVATSFRELLLLRRPLL